jgi:hypothetical protein
MLAKLIRSTGEEGDAMIIEINGRQITGMDNVVYSALPYPKPDEEFEVRFTCMFVDDFDIGPAHDEHVQWQVVFNGNAFEEQMLIPTGLWSYRALGKLVRLDTYDNIALADCGAGLIPIPLEVSDPDCLGCFIGFDIFRLDIWRG